jgi:hypothetical protein
VESSTYWTAATGTRRSTGTICQIASIRTIELERHNLPASTSRTIPTDIKKSRTGLSRDSVGTAPWQQRKKSERKIRQEKRNSSFSTRSCTRRFTVGKSVSQVSRWRRSVHNHVSMSDSDTSTEGHSPHTSPQYSRNTSRETDEDTMDDECLSEGYNPCILALAQEMIYLLSLQCITVGTWLESASFATERFDLGATLPATRPNDLLSDYLTGQLTCRATDLSSNSPNNNSLSDSRLAPSYVPRRLNIGSTSYSDYLPSESLTGQLACRATRSAETLPELCHWAARHREQLLQRRFAE